MSYNNLRRLGCRQCMRLYNYPRTRKVVGHEITLRPNQSEFLRLKTIIDLRILINKYSTCLPSRAKTIEAAESAADASPAKSEPGLFWSILYDGL